MSGGSIWAEKGSEVRIRPTIIHPSPKFYFQRQTPATFFCQHLFSQLPHCRLHGAVPAFRELHIITHRSPTCLAESSCKHRRTVQMLRPANPAPVTRSPQPPSSSSIAHRMIPESTTKMPRIWCSARSWRQINAWPPNQLVVPERRNIPPPLAGARSNLEATWRANLEIV